MTLTFLISDNLEAFDIVGIQTDNTLLLADENFIVNKKDTAWCEITGKTTY